MPTRSQRIAQRRADQAAAEHDHPRAGGPVPSLPVRVLCSGSLASVFSTLAVSAFSRRRSGAAAAGTNAASQWFWYPRARHVERPSPKYTLVGYAVHHASSLLWAAAFEALQPAQARPGGQLARAAGIASLAYVVDYHVVPRRLSPGFEHRIGPAGMCAAYAAFGLGLLLATRAMSRKRSHAALNGAPCRPPRPARNAPVARLPGH